MVVVRWEVTVGCMVEGGDGGDGDDGGGWLWSGCGQYMMGMRLTLYPHCVDNNEEM